MNAPYPAKKMPVQISPICIGRIPSTEPGSTGIPVRA
jgi:hypothetical protein